MSYLDLDKIKKEKTFTDFDYLKIQIASPEVIRNWSYGEVTKSDTINYRTQKPERDGLFCERIFGPVRDYECSCGKYKKVKYKGIVCEQCGVGVTTSAVRRKRMGHIELAVPVVHPLFYRTAPSKVALLLGLKTSELNGVINYEKYIVLKQGNSPFKKGEVIGDGEEYKEYIEEYDDFEAGLGAPALKKLLEEIDLDEISIELKIQIKHETSNRNKLLKRLKVVEAFRHSGNRPEWMILDVIPVIPPDLRPLVPLEGGIYATSDINDLYKRVIVRNNRLKHLMAIKTPEIILKNEKRLLQDAVDALFDNEHRSRPVLGKGDRPLKSLSETLRGKKGRFRRNLLGKRVDYSGRSSIVVNPKIKLHECLLPKEMVKELFKPMVFAKLEKYAEKLNVSSRYLFRKDSPVMWDVVEKVSINNPVLLNRAPTLHRVSVEAFFPKLWEHKAIGIHPLVCPPFNADFDGDTMSVHVPLIPEAIIESMELMLAPHNILSPANGKPLMVPTQDMVAGMHYITKEKYPDKERKKYYDTFEEVRLAYEEKIVDFHTPVFFRWENKWIPTIVGRIFFNEVLPEEFRFINETMNKKRIAQLVYRIFRKLGTERTAEILDAMKELGFRSATQSALSIGMDDLQVPQEKKKIINRSLKEVEKVTEAYKKGLITESEKYNRVVNIWTLTTSEIEEALMKNLKKMQNGFNPLYLLIDSGARGSKLQILQLTGMRGLMTKPSRKLTGEEVIETPIINSFKEGISVIEFFISTHGARKGLTDTALKTADAGYLTRRLVDAVQDIMVSMEDCRTIMGVEIGYLREGGEIIERLAERIVGHVALEDIVHPVTKKVIVKKGEEITEEKAEEIELSGMEKVKVRFVLTCEAPFGVCAKCYGRNFATGKMVEIGEAVGIVAAQSIGEPGTQLTLRTFHTGGIAERTAEETLVKAKISGEVKIENVKDVIRSDGNRVVMEEGKLFVISGEKRVVYIVPKGSIITVKNGEKVEENQPLFDWEPYTIQIMAGKEGTVKYKDVIPGVTLREDIDERTEQKQLIIMDDRRKRLHPAVEIVNKDGEVVETVVLPTGCYLIVNEGSYVKSGDLIAKLLRESGKTRDITGGLPRVVDLFEARSVHNAAVISEIDGIVEVGTPSRGTRIVRVTADTGEVREYKIGYGRYLRVGTGDRVKAGDKLCEGPINPQDVLKVKGVRAVQEFLTNQIQAVYRLQDVKIADKHIALIVRQMLRKVKIEYPGDSLFIEGDIVDKEKVKKENERLIKEGMEPAKFKPILLGITKVAGATDSFLAAASFQETTRILSEAAIEGRKDYLRGLMENVIVGRVIPTGTGFRKFRNIKLKEKKKKEAI